MQADEFRRQLDMFSTVRQTADKFLYPEITFDDGHISNHELAAPLLAAHGMLAHFFITAGWTGTKPGYMGWAELRALHAAGHTIGAHGWSHTLLTRLNADDLMRELEQSRKTIEDNLGTEVRTMSLPGGRRNPRVLAACEEVGYEHVFTSVPQAAHMPLNKNIGRMNVLASMQPEWLEKVLDPTTHILASMERTQRIKDAAKSLLGDRLYRSIWSAINRQEQEDPSA